MRTPKKTTQEQIDALDLQIEKVQANLDRLTDQREALMEKLKAERLSAIYELMTDNDISVSELEDLIKTHIEQGREVA